MHGVMPITTHQFGVAIANALERTEVIAIAHGKSKLDIAVVVEIIGSVSHSTPKPIVEEEESADQLTQ